MDLELSELRSFVVLADLLHFGRAADQLHITQPALTKQIQRLEAKLGGPLLVRGGRRVELTVAGAVLRDRARALLRDAEAAARATRLAAEGKAGVLRVGFGIASLTTDLAGMLTRFRERYPDVQVTLRDMSTPAQIEALERGTIDVGFVRLPVERPGLVAIPVLEERLVIAVQRGTRVRGGLAGLRDEPFVLVSRATSASFYDHVLRTCRAAGFGPRIVQEANELFTVLQLVGAGVGVSLVPGSAEAMRVPNVRLVETGLDEARWRIGLAWRKDGPSEPLVRRFLEARDAAAE
jgi:DNA-binding transcriptional LysR family regulator